MLSTEGLPSVNTVKIGLTHLNDYLSKKRDIIEPAIVPFPKMDYKNILMLGYYRNPLNHVYFNEGVIIVSMLSFGGDRAWSNSISPGVNIEELFERTVFLADLLKREEVLKERISLKTRHVFENILNYMLERKVLQKDSANNLSLKSS